MLASFLIIIGVPILMPKLFGSRFYDYFGRSVPD